MISPYLDSYCKLMDFDPGATEGYLFCCGDTFERNQPESMWTSTVKKVFKTYSPGKTETPPKLLRSSFITFLRSEERTPELLKSCAVGMTHALDTQASDVYDTATHDTSSPNAASISVNHLPRNLRWQTEEQFHLHLRSQTRLVYYKTSSVGAETLTARSASPRP